MANPMMDVIVVLPGIMGSTLYREDAPVWAPTSGALVEALGSLLRSVRTLRLPEGIGDGHPGDGVEACDLMPDLRLPFGVWTFDLGYTALLDALRSRFELIENPGGRQEIAANLVTFPYDWRLSNRYNGERLKETAEAALGRWRDLGEEYKDAKLVLIAHSMGGLVARWYLDHRGGGDVTRTLITLGTPHRGALNALEQLVNGVRKGPGPFKVNLTTFARSLPSLHQLLPEYACVEHGDTLAKTTEIDLPEVTSAMVGDAMAFHNQIDAGRTGKAKPAYELHPILGFKQPTWTTARIEAGRVRTIRTIRDKDEHGDATVPCLSAAPPDVKPRSAIIRHIADNHGGLVHNRGVFDEIEGILTASDIVHRAAQIHVSVEVEEVLDASEPLRIRAELPDHERVALEAVIADEQGRHLETIRLAPADGALRADRELPGPGVYGVTVRGVGAARHQVVAVTTAVLAWPPEASFDARNIAGDGA